MKENINKLTKFISKLFKDNYIYIIGIFLFIYKGVVLNSILNIEISLKLFIVASAVPALLLIPCIGKKHKRAIIYLNIIYTIITFIIYGDYIYYKYSTNFLSVYQIQNIQYGHEISLALPLLITFKNIVIFWSDNIILLLVSIYFRKKYIDEKNKIYTMVKIIVTLLLITVNMYIYTKHIALRYNEFIYNKTVMVSRTTIYYYHVADIKEYITESFFKDKIDNNMLRQEYENNISQKIINEDYTAIAQNYNVIILQLESMHEFLINSKINGKEITPNLNRFYNSNIYFSNMYNQGLGSTADSEHEVATSMYPLENGRAYQKYFDNKWHDIFGILKENGYFVSFMHPNTSTFWNRHQVYNIGYKVDEYNTIESFEENSEMAGEFFSDEQFLIQAVDKIKNYEEPYVTMLVTVSSHIPYSLEGINNLEDKISIDVSNIEDINFANYLKSSNFVDYSFGRFLEELEKSNLLKKTILIVYADHGASLANSDGAKVVYEQNNILHSDSMVAVENTHVNFGMSLPNINNLIIEDAVAKIDIKPTILNILGVEDKFSLGKDMFTSQDYAFIKGIGFVTKDKYYINGNLIDRETNNILNITDKIRILVNQMEGDMHLSDMIIRNDLLNKIPQLFTQGV